MNSFVKFIFTLLAVGMVVNVAIVLMANAQSQRRQAADAIEEKAQFREQIKHLNEIGRLQRMDMTVEWQTEHAREGPLRTSLLVRQYVISQAGEPVALPLVRVEIPGNRVSVDGLLLHFDSLFHEQDYEMLQDMSLFYFAHIYADSEADADRYSFLQNPQVPQLTRIHPDEPKPSFYEIRLWQFLWDLIPDPPRSTPAVGGSGSPPADPRSAVALRRGLKVTWTPPDTRAVRVGDTLSAFIGSDGIVKLEVATSPGLRNSMLDEAEAMKAKLNGVVPQPLGTAPGER